MTAQDGGPLQRTLVVSDLHLGTRGHRDLLQAAPVRRALTAALAGVGRLVLLGDIVELRQGPAREALASSEAALTELASALDPGARVTIVPGNHDHQLVVPWRERRARRGPPPEMGLESAVDWRAGEPLARLVKCLGSHGGEVEVTYPGRWLRPDVYATHGHYSDRHTTVPMLERLGAGAMARIIREPAAGPRSTEDYEAVLAPMYAWMDAMAQTGGSSPRRATQGASAAAWRALGGGGRPRGLRRRALRGAFPALVAGLSRAGLGELSADLSSDGLRRARLCAMGEVLLRLGVEARHVIFGHSHRAGPLPGDDPSEWGTATGVRLTNTGCWLDEPAPGDGAGAPSRDRPGFAVIVEESGPPVLVNLLDELGRR